MSVRTVQDFVEDLVSNGRTLQEILHVTFCTRWQAQKSEVMDEFRKLKRRRFPKNECVS